MTLVSNLTAAFQEIGNDIAARPIIYDSKAALQASNVASRGVGAIWRAGTQLYKEAASGVSDQALTTVSGVKLYEAGSTFSSVANAQNGDTLGAEQIIVDGIIYNLDPSGSDLTTGDGLNWTISINQGVLGFYSQTDTEMQSVVIPDSVSLIVRMPSGTNPSEQVAAANKLTFWRREDGATTAPYFTTSGGQVWIQVGIREDQILSYITSALDLAFSDREFSGLIPFPTRSEFLSADILATVTRHSFMVDGYEYVVVRSATGEIVQDNGDKWAPAGDAYAEHYGLSISASSANAQAAIVAALNAHDTVYLRPAIYNLGSNPIVITEDDKSLIGKDPSNRTLLVFGSNNGITFQPVDPSTTATINKPRLENLAISGAGSSATAGYGLSMIQCANGVCKNISVQNFYSQVLIEGGQNNKFIDPRVFGYAGGVIADVSGRYLIHIKPHERSGDTTIACYVVTIVSPYLGGGIPHYNCEDAIRVEGVDGLDIRGGYVNGGRESLIHFTSLENSSAGAITGAIVSGVYFDGTLNSGGSKYGVKFSNDANVSGSTVNGLELVGNILGNNSVSGIYSSTGKIRRLNIIGGRVSYCTGRAIDVTGSSNSTTGSEIKLSGVHIAQSAGSRFTNAQSLTVDGNTFSDQETNPALEFAGTIVSATHNGNIYRNNSGSDFLDNATITTRAYGENAGNMSGSRDRGTFTPVFRIGGGTPDSTVATSTGRYTRTKDMISFRVEVILSNKGTTTGDVTIRVPSTDANGVSMPGVPVGRQPVSIRAVYLDSVNFGSGEDIFADVNNIGTNGFDININRRNSFGQSAPITDADLEDTSSFYVQGVVFI